MPSNRTRIGGGYGSTKNVKKLFGRTGYVPFRTGRRQGTALNDKPFPEPPLDWLGTRPEWAIFWAHGAIGRKEHQDFEYIYYLGFEGDKSAQVDFFELDISVAIEVQGLYWHYGIQGYKPAQDIDRKVRLEALGNTLVFIDEDDALSNPIYYLKEALMGRDHSRAVEGF